MPMDQASGGDVSGDLKCWLAVEVMIEDVIAASDSLFQELHMQYKLLVTEFDSSIYSKQDVKHLGCLFPMGGFLLLLRNCMVVLPFLEFNGSILLEKCGILVAMLGSLCSYGLRSKVSCHKIQNKMSFGSFEREISHDGSNTQMQLDGSMCFPEQIVSGASFLCSILEVFLNELFLCRELKDYFLTADGVCSSKNVFVNYGSGEDAVLEVISAHFLMSVCDQWAFERFPHTLFWSYGRSADTLQLSLAAALTFLGNPDVATAPKIFRAHLVSLVSSCIGISMPSNYCQTTPLLLSNYMSAFEESVNLYNREILLYQGDDHSIGTNSQSVWQMESSSSFESHVRPETYAEIKLQIGKLINAFQQHFGDSLSESRSDLLHASMTFVKENQFVLDENCRDEACAILNCIIWSSLVEETEVKAFDKSGEISQDELYLLASIVKLMSCSLLQIIWFMRISLKSGSLKVLSHSSSCGEYGFLIGIINLFMRCSVNRPIQKTLKDVMNLSPAKHKESKFILMHFAGMLSFSFDRRLEFFWKGCLFMVMSLINLFILEEGNLDALKPLIGWSRKTSFSTSSSTKISELKPLFGHSEKPSCSTSCLTKISEGPKYQRSCQVVASKLQKIQMIYLKNKCEFLTNHIRKGDGPVDDLSGAQADLLGTPQDALCSVNMKQNDMHDVHVEDEDVTSSGEDFLKCRGISLDQDGDLADFIACTPGKDYSNWWKQRERYRKWKHGLRASKQKERHRMGRHGPLVGIIDRKRVTEIDQPR